MKLLFDESVPRRLANSFPDRFETKTVTDMEWSGVDNGRLLDIAARAGFKALITVDKNMAHQQNPNTLPIAIIILSPLFTRINFLTPLVPEVISILEDNPGKRLIRIPDGES
ncbi:MAG: DUF5615 family PIN-like protein [Gammaproteobacteria bacterium]|nr:DUF5615 family PIN-like protein [Gammaproteobacteria bacterium]